MSGETCYGSSTSSPAVIQQHLWAAGVVNAFNVTISGRVVRRRSASRDNRLSFANDVSRITTS